jgi:uncharacterized protein (DUF2147 family)
MKTALLTFALASFAALFSAGSAYAQATPVGLWKTIDDETKQERSLVRINEEAGVLSGRIEKLLDPSKAGSVCEECTDERKGQPITGMTIISGAKKEADAQQWSGGSILDPNNGKTYKLRLTPMDGGKALEVRGYVGFFFRNQTWIRVE